MEHLEQVLWQFAKNSVDIGWFEQWVYTHSSELKSFLEPDLYLEMLALDFSNPNAVQAMRETLGAWLPARFRTPDGKIAARWRMLGGLPGTGPHPEQYGYTGQACFGEGTVVEFTTRTGQRWIGNFESGLSDFEIVLNHPDKQHIVVIACGTGYVVDPDGQQLIEAFGSQIDTVLEVSDHELLIFGTPFVFHALGPTGWVWRSEQISCDGFRNLEIDGDYLTGEAWIYAGESEWLPFRLNIRTGEHVGGA